MGATSSKFTFGPHMSATWGALWGQLWPTRPQRGPNLDPFGSNFVPTWVPQAATWPQATSAQIELHMGSTWGTLPARCDIVKKCMFTGISHVLLASVTLRIEQCSPCCVSVGLTWREAVAKGAQPKLRHVEHDLRTWLEFGVHLDGLGPNFSPAWAIGSIQLGLSWAPFGASRYFQLFCQTCPSCVQTCPSLPGQVGAKWSEFGASYALGTSRLLFGPT